MFTLFKPSDAEISDFIAAQSNQTLSYPEIGETKNRRAPDGYPINQLRGKLGDGELTYENAVAALHSWQMYATGWTEIYPKNAPVANGEIVLMLVNHLGFRSLNPCRVVYKFDEETTDFRRSAFAVGTLPQHSEKGEERFMIEWDKQTGAVYYDLYAFTRAHNRLAKIGFPFVPLFQKRFAADSLKAMTAAVNGK